MATEGLSMIAGGTIRPARFVTVSAAADNTVLESNAGDAAIVGVAMEGYQDAPVSGGSTNAAESGDSLRIHTAGAVCLLEMDSSGCTAGDFLKPDNDGLGDVAATGATAAAIALETAAASEKCLVLVISPHNVV